MNSISYKHRHLYLFELPKGKDVSKIVPYQLLEFRPAKTKPELVEFLQEFADKNADRELFFSLRKGGNIWRLHKTDDEY